MPYDSNIIEVRAEKLNLDLECLYDLINGRGIRLTSVQSFDSNKNKIYNGLQSTFFGTDFADDYAFSERYRCECGERIGKAYEGLLCDKCGTAITYKDIDISKTGWIILDHFKLLSPLYAAKLYELLGKHNGEYVLNNILDIRKAGEIHDGNPKTLEALKKHPFIGKGMLWLIENLSEVLNYYRNKKSKLELIEELELDGDAVFTSSIPIYSALLRTELPGEKGGKIFKLRVNTRFQTIIGIVNSINSVDVEDNYGQHEQDLVNRLLFAVQKELFEFFNENVKELSGKRGIVQSKVCASRLNWSARNIIVCGNGKLRANEIEVGYITFMELYRYEIMNLYSKLKGCGMVEANIAWNNARDYIDSTMMSIINEIIKNPENRLMLTILICRNPSINYGSFLTMRIVGVHQDISNKSMVLPTAVLSSLNADFDGDVLNLFRIFSEKMIKEFDKNLNPRRNLFVKRTAIDEINLETFPGKDLWVGFHAFCTL